MKNTDLAKKIRTLHTNNGYSQEQLANITELSLRTVQRIENGETEPRGDTLIRLANALDVTPNDLIEWVEKEDRGFMAFLNVSALSFIVFPLLGLIVPLALWVLKKDKIKNIDSVGKKLLNFQITWCLVIFTWYMLLIGSMVFAIKLPNFGGFAGMGSAEIMLLMVPGILYPYNFIFIIINAVRSYNTGKVFYQPAIRFMK